MNTNSSLRTIMKIAANRKWMLAITLAAMLPGAAFAQDDKYEEPLAKGVLGRTGFAVEEFVPNRVKIETTAEDKRYNASEPFQVDVKAEEMFGQPISGKPVSATVTWKAEPFTPKEWEGYTFGDRERKFETREMPSQSATLEEDGRTSVVAMMPKGRPPAALSATMQVTVTEGGRGVTRTIKRIVDPVPYYLGIKTSADTFALPGQDATYDIAAVQPSGQVAPSDTLLTGSISLVKWNSSLVREGDSYVFKTSRELQEVKETSVTLSGGKGQLTWAAPSVGNYLVRLYDTASSASVSNSIYVSDRSWGYQPWSMEKPESVELVPDKKKYAVGETARVLIKAPFPGTVLFTMEQDRVVTSTIFTMEQNTLEVPVPITENMLPNAYAVAEVIRPVKAEAEWLPHRAVGMVNLPVASDARKLDIALTAPVEVRPGQELVISAEVKDSATSAPVEGDIVLWAVDEGVLSLTEFKTPSPGEFFAMMRRLAVSTSDIYSNLMPELIEGAVAASGTGGGDGEGAGRQSPVSSERVKPVVLWHAPARTSADGKLEVRFTVPPFMGQLRVMAMAANGQKFGNGDKTVFVRTPVMVREHLPRFAAPGDQFTAGFTVYNNSDAAITPNLDVNMGSLLETGSESSRALASIPPRKQTTEMQPVTVKPDAYGHSLINVKASAGSESFETSVSLPVRPASPRITESGSAVVLAGKSDTIKMPGADYYPVSTSATLIVGGRPDLQLAGALDYNIRYPYGCTEQTVSGVFPLLYLQDLARNSNPEQYSREGIQAIVQAGIDRLFMAQTTYGGLAMWIDRRDPWLWSSIYAAHFLTEAKKAGYQIPQDYYDALLDYLQSETLETNSNQDFLTQKAYTCYVLSRAGRKAQQRMELLYDLRSKLSIEGSALLAAAYKENGLPEEARALLQVKPLANVDATSITRETGNILASPIRETAMLLLSWIEVDPDSRETMDLAQRLLKLRHNNTWGTTQDNAFAMLALGRFAQVTAKDEPAKGTVRYAGQTKEFSTSQPLVLSAADLVGAEVTIENTAGTAYATWMASGIPSAPREAVANGLSISRRLLNRAGEEVDPMALRQGDLVLVELTIEGNRSLENVVITDLLPAGLEIENPRLASAELAEEEAEDDPGVLIDRMDVRDDRMILFGSLTKQSGTDPVQTYRYTTRAVTPGTYAWPGTSLDVMYDPQINAISSPGSVTVTERQ